MTAFKTDIEVAMSRLEGMGMKLGGTATLEDLQAYLDGRVNPLYEFNDEVMTKETWMERYAKRMVDLAKATPEFAKASAEACFDPTIWALHSPEEAAEEDMSCWGE